MKIKNNIRAKMLFYILIAFAVVYGASFAYISIKMNRIVYDDAIELADTYAREYANYTRADLNVDMDMSRAFAQTLQAYETFPEERISLFKDMMTQLLTENDNFLAVWYSLELTAVDENWIKPFGRERVSYYKIGNELRYYLQHADTVAGFPRGAYYEAMEINREQVTNPYWYAFQVGEEPFFETSFGVPVRKDGKYIGLAGVDLELSRFQTLIEKISPLEQSYAYLVANDGQFVAHPQEAYVGTNLMELEAEDSDVLEKIQNAEPFSFIRVNDETNQDMYYSYYPVVVGDSYSPWSFAFVVPLDVILDEAHNAIRNTILIGIIGLLLIMVVIFIIASNITKPIAATTHILGELALGNIDINNKIDIKTDDEIGEMGNSVNTVIEGLTRTAGFAKEIGKGNLEEDFELLSDADVLGNALLEMRNSLKDAKNQEDLRKDEDRKQNWVTQGLAKFGEILRQNNDDMNEFAYHILSNLVKYINANQGGLFLLNDDDGEDVFLELLACYAYERRKYIEKRVDIGVGLIGKCVQERKSVYMTDLPDDYISITSGLGKAKPNALLIVPLKMNDQIFGIIELAGFDNFEDHVVGFVETVGESIASTISSTKINIRTNKLLEQSQQQSEEMAAQEEEMRQNMEELQATQEEAGRRSTEMQGLLDALNTANLVVEYDLDGYVLSVNDNYLNLVGASREDILNTHHVENMDFSDKEIKDNDAFWKDLKSGMAKKVTNRLVFNDRKYTFVETYTPILDEMGSPLKILKIATDITDIDLKTDKKK